MNSLLNLGYEYLKKKDFEKAIHPTRRALELKPDLGPAHINIAVGYYMLGNYNSSWKHSRKAERLGLPQAKVLIQKLKMVSKEPDY